MKLEDLKPAGWNPREITPQALAGLRESIKRLGDISGIVWNKRSGTLVCGHQRILALREEYGAGLKVKGKTIHCPGGTRFSVRIVDWPADMERLANLAANNPKIMGDFTADAVALLEQVKAEWKDAAVAFRFDELEKEIAAVFGEAPGPGGGSAGAEKSVFRYTLTFDDEDQMAIMSRFLLQLRKDRDEETPGGRLAGFLGEHLEE